MEVKAQVDENAPQMSYPCRFLRGTNSPTVPVMLDVRYQHLWPSSQQHWSSIQPGLRWIGLTVALPFALKA